jgi:hypothetical protein
MGWGGISVCVCVCVCVGWGRGGKSSGDMRDSLAAEGAYCR